MKDSEVELVEAAESLFALNSIGATSLRQIAESAGANNHYAVQYHFKDKRGLCQAIFRHRLPALERRRAELLSNAAEKGTDKDLHTILDVLFRPIGEIRNSRGEAAYAGFMFQLYAWSGSLDIRSDLSTLAPFTHFITQSVHQHAPFPIPEPLFQARLFQAGLVFLNIVRPHGLNLPGIDPEGLTAEGIHQVYAILTSPIDPAIQRKFSGT